MDLFRSTPNREQRAIDICWDLKETSDFHYSVLRFYVHRGYVTPKQADAVIRAHEESLREPVFDSPRPWEIEDHAWDVDYRPWPWGSD